MIFLIFNDNVFNFNLNLHLRAYIINFFILKKQVLIINLLHNLIFVTPFYNANKTGTLALLYQIFSSFCCSVL